MLKSETIKLMQKDVIDWREKCQQAKDRLEAALNEMVELGVEDSDIRRMLTRVLYYGWRAKDGSWHEAVYNA